MGDAISGSWELDNFLRDLCVKHLDAVSDQMRREELGVASQSPTCLASKQHTRLLIRVIRRRLIDHFSNHFNYLSLPFIASRWAAGARPWLLARGSPLDRTLSFDASGAGGV